MAAMMAVAARVRRAHAAFTQRYGVELGPAVRMGQLRTVAFR
jgi:hypothetical protein